MKVEAFVFFLCFVFCVFGLFFFRVFFLVPYLLTSLLSCFWCVCFFLFLMAI